MKKKINHYIKQIKKIVLKDKFKTGLILGSLLVFVILYFQVGIVRAILFTGILDVLALVVNYFMTHKMTKSRRKRIIKRVVTAIFMLIIMGLIAIGAFIAYIVGTSPKFDPANLNRNESSILYDKDGNIYAKLGLEKREKITYDQMPEVLINSIIATEDSRFFQHNGFDLPRFVKATFGQLLGKDAGGASTITMQVSKNSYTSSVASGFEGIKRKFTDIYISVFQIERKYTKKEILEFYVNQPYLGSGAYGVEQACQTYFGKSAKDINLSEAAMIAGLFQAPNAYDPYKYPEETTKRRSQVLYLMELHGYITTAERKAANAIAIADLLAKASVANNSYQDFIDTVIEDVIETTGKDPYLVSMQIYTTMDRAKQEYVNDIMTGKTYKWENPLITAGVSILDVKTGAIIAIGAGRNRVQRGFNTATMIKRQIGSTAKPIYDYGPLIEFKNASTYEPFIDEPYGYTGGGNIKNWDDRFMGFLTLRFALSRSRNIPALKAFKANNNNQIKTFVTSLGLSPEISGGVIHEAHAIGGYNGESPLTMSAAYAAFANGGYYVKPYSFTKIVYRETGDVFDNKTKKTSVMSPETAYMINDISQTTAEYVMGSSTMNGGKFGIKTGTTNFSNEIMKAYKMPASAINDLWVDGSSTDYSISLWYGYEKISSEYVTLTTSGAHVKLFKKIAQGVFKSGSAFVKPAGVVSVQIEKETYPAMLPSANTPSDLLITELFKKGTEPTEVSDRFNNLSSVTGLASSVTGNNVKLTWNAIALPKAYDPTSLNTYFNSLYTNEGYRTNAYNARIAYNSNNIGDLGYNIYIKNNDNSLTLLGFTKTTSYDNIVTDSSSVTYVVKSTFNVFTASESSGTEVTASVSLVVNNITLTLNGGVAPIILNKNAAYEEQNITVMENTVDITDSSSVVITRSFKKGAAPTTDTINTANPGTYTETYTVTRGSYVGTIDRTIIVNN